MIRKATSTIAASELVEDFAIYPRERVDDQYVGYLAEAMSAGAIMPPVVADRATKRIVDGFQRRRAMQKLHGPDAEIEVEFRDYANDGELFLDSARLNSAHGRRMTSVDFVRVIHKARELGVDDSMIAKSLNLTVEKLGDLVVDRSASFGKLSTNQPVRLKRTIRHLAGRRLTQEQFAANKRLSGMNQQFYVNQVITLIESDTLNRDDEALMERLRVLGKLIRERCGKQKV